MINFLDQLTSVTRDSKIIETLGWGGISLRLEDMKKYEESTELGTQQWQVKISRATVGQVGLIARDDTVFANEAHVSGGVPLVAATSDGSDASYFDSDYLGTTTASYSADGEVNAYEHGSFGQGTEFADARFTGKHYDADLGAHVFPFRNYRSDAGRWTSADPAGFPDGPNQHFYAPVPTMGLDPLGLAYVEVEEQTSWDSVLSSLENSIRERLGLVGNRVAAAHYVKLFGDFNESNHTFYSIGATNEEGLYTFAGLPASYTVNLKDITRGTKILNDGTEIEVLTVISEYRVFIGFDLEGLPLNLTLQSDTITLKLEAEK